MATTQPKRHILDAGAGSETTTFERDVLVLGRRLRYVDIGVGPPLVFVHGTGGSWQVWRANLGELSRRHRVIAIDLPGFGDSEPIEPPTDMSIYATFLAELLRTLDVVPATIIGHSLGGMVCLHYAVKYPERTRSLVLVDSGGAPISERRKSMVVYGLRIAHAAMGLPFVMKAFHAMPRLRARALGLVVNNPESVRSNLVEGAFLTMRAPGVLAAITAGIQDSVGSQLRQVRVPALVIWGEHDRLLPLRYGREMVDLMPDARLVTFPTGHCPNIEQSTEFNLAVESWIDQFRPPVDESSQHV